MEHKYRKTLITTLVLSGLYGNSSAEVIMDGSAGTAGEIQATPDNVYEITSDKGHISGHNLFHSFSEFNVEKNYTANFSDTSNAGISNVIARVTGPDPSQIDGTIKSSIPNADLYLLNPNGIMFGKDASIDINGSFYASTANYLKFDDGYKLDQTANPNMTFTSAAPSAFGFTTDTPASIAVNGSNLSVNDGKTLSLIGGDVTLDGAALSASDGIVNIASVASQGEVVPTADDVQMNNFSELGNVDLVNGADVDASGNSGGHIVIRGGNLTLDNSSIEANTTGSGTNDYSKNVDVVAQDSITLDNSSTITTNAEILSQADTKGVSLAASHITIKSNSSVESNTSSTFGSNSGDIDINSNDLTIYDYGYLHTETSNTGDGGNININTADLNITQVGYIEAVSNGDGNSGDIKVNSSNITINDNDFKGLYTEKNNEPSLGGNIVINNSDTVTLDGRGSIFTDNNGATVGGDINISSHDINVLRGSQIGTTSQGDGNGGNITVDTKELTISGVHEDYKLMYGIVPVFDQSRISTTGPIDYLSTGTTGDINLNAVNLSVLDGAVIETTSGISINQSNNIRIKAQNIKISGNNQLMEQTYINTGFTEKSAIKESSSRVQANNISFNIDTKTESSNLREIDIVADTLSLTSGGYITTESYGTVASNDIHIVADNIVISDGSYITSSGANSIGGDSGNIYIGADNFRIDGGKNNFSKTGVYSDTNPYGGKGGNIELLVGKFELTNGADISTVTTGASNGGNINITAKNSVRIKNSSKVTAKSYEQATGNAGDISIDSDLFVLQHSEISTSAIKGQGGNIEIRANNIITTPDSIINAASEQSVSGSVNIITNGNIVSNLAKLPDQIERPTNIFYSNCSRTSDNDSSFVAASSFSSFSVLTYLPSQIDSHSFKTEGALQHAGTVNQQIDTSYNYYPLPYEKCFLWSIHS